ncbi:hypothetical protein BJF85_04645 [Saccharomonospora sp. CUA-673]|nr:hypothetical protein BJF85_04645 [Saccharomonospora sp. CUA-673]
MLLILMSAQENVLVVPDESVSHDVDSRRHRTILSRRYSAEVVVGVFWVLRRVDWLAWRSG